MKCFMNLLSSNVKTISLVRHNLSNCITQNFISNSLIRNESQMVPRLCSVKIKKDGKLYSQFRYCNYQHLNMIKTSSFGSLLSSTLFIQQCRYYR